MRLLKIQPGEADDPIRGELIIVSTDSQEDYDAVSYTWADQTGDATRRFRAFIGSGYVSITRSCQEVLQRIRSRFYTKCVWIDSLCVDQDNLQERGHQVQLMPRIYTRAKKTYVYVGPTTFKEESILKCLATGRWEQNWSAGEEPFWFTRNNLLRRPYFFRVWIIQEIALSPNPVILCGKDEFPWSVLRNDTPLQSLPERLKIGWEERFAPPLLSLGKRRLRYSAELLDLLRLGRRCQSTDPRDRVFALFGLVADAEAEGLVADYERSTTEIFTWIARYLANMGTIGDVLGHVNMCRDERLLEFPNQLQLPSWVPDWTNAETTCLDLFPEARTYLKNLPLQLDELDNKALVLTGFNIGYTNQHRIPDRLSLRTFGVPMFVRPLESSQRLILFQGEEETSGTDLPEYLIILGPVTMNMNGNSEVPGWRDSDVNDELDSTFRFLGLLRVHAPIFPHGFTRSDLVSIKLV